MRQGWLNRWWEERKFRWYGQFHYKNKLHFDPTWHLYVCGTTGTGKTNTVMHILNEYYSDIPYVIIEPTESRQYRKLQSLSKRPFHLFSIGENRGDKLELSPFYIPYGRDFTSHVELLKVCMSNALKTKETLVDSYLDRAIPEVYFDKGWNRDGTHPMLKKSNDYIGEEHYFYFPRMCDLYNKVIQLAEDTDFQKGGENKGTITEILKSSIRPFLTGPLGISFNTYKNDLYNIVNDNIVFEIPNTMPDSVAIIMNFMMANIITISGERGEVEECKHVTVFEEAHLLFGADEDGKTHKSTGKRLTHLLSTARKFGESIIVVNQDPRAIHKSVIEQLSQRIIHKINSSEICKHLAADYNIYIEDIILCEKYRAWFKANDQHRAIQYSVPKVDIPVQTYKATSTVNYIAMYAGLENIHEQLANTINFLDAVCVSRNYQLEVKRFKKALSAEIGKECKVEEDILPEYMAYLTCVAYVKLQVGRIPLGSYKDLTEFYKKTLNEKHASVPLILHEINPLLFKVLKESL